MTRNIKNVTKSKEEYTLLIENLDKPDQFIHILEQQRFFRETLNSVNRTQWTVYGEMPLHKQFKQLHACDIVVFFT